MRKLLTFIAAILLTGSLFAGGLVTNTNQSAAWVRLPSRNASVNIELLSDGKISGIDNSGWTFSNDLLTLNLQDGTITVDALLSDEWDWENDTLAVCFSGISNEGKTAWGKKVAPGNQ